jgi:hypothetical protein
MANLPRMRRAAVGAIAALAAGVVTLAALPPAPVAASSRHVGPASFLYVAQHSPPGEAPTAVEIFRAFWEKPGQLGLCMCTIGSQPRAVRWLRQLTPASAPRHGEITVFIDSSVPIKYAGDPASPAGRMRRRP